MTAATCRSSWITVAKARTSAYLRPRLMRGCTSRRRCWIAAQRSRTNSPSDRAAASGRRRRGWRSRRSSPARAGRGGAVEHRAHRQHASAAASPERMFARLAPSACSRPRPSEWRRSISAASRGWLVTIARAALLLPPAERGHVVVVAVQQPGLAGAGLRGPVGLPALRAGGRRRASSARASARCRRAARAAARRGRARRSPGRARRARRVRISPPRAAGLTGGRRCGTSTRRRRSRAAKRWPTSRSSARSSRRRRGEAGDSAPGTRSIAKATQDRVEHERREAEGQHGERQREAGERARRAR